jgi:hypothetical protein
MPALFRYQLASDIHFLLKSGGSRTAFQVSPHVRLLHPLLKQSQGREEPWLLPFSDGRVLYSTSFLTFVTNESVEFTKITIHEDLLEQVLRRLRITTRQASIPRQILSLVRWEADLEDESIRTPAFDGTAKAMVQEQIAKTAVTEEHMFLLESEEVPSPIHEDLLLDALEALNHRSFRTSIIYAAFAAEAAASLALATALADALSTRPGHLRVSTFSVHGGGQSIKEPVYEALSKDGFGALLHERPLYLLQRSLLLEREALYAALVKLYRTRNSIVHSSHQREVYEPTAGNAHECIRNVISLLTWLHLKDDFVLPGHFLDVGTGGLRSLSDVRVE